MIIIINIIIIIIYNTPGTAGGRDRTLAVKIPKRQKNLFCMYLLVMPKYWVIPQSGSKAENGEEKKKRKRDRKLVIKMAKLRMAHASRLGQFMIINFLIF